MALINCPECGKEISDKAASCPNCGMPIKETETKFCQHCGEEIDFDCVVCPKCGKQVEELKAEFKKKHSVVGIIGFILSIIGVFGGIGLSVFLFIASIILCIIGCLEKDKKHGFAIAGNIVSFLFLFMILISLIYLSK